MTSPRSGPEEAQRYLACPRPMQAGRRNQSFIQQGVKGVSLPPACPPKAATATIERSAMMELIENGWQSSSGVLTGASDVWKRVEASAREKGLCGGQSESI